jgi:hypothetical protein
VVVLRKGIQLLIIFTICISTIPTPVNAYRWQENLSWNNGIRVRVFIENVDYWTTDVDFEIYVHLTLIESGYVTDFLSLTFVLYLLTEEMLSQTTVLESH